MSERDGWNHLYLYDGATGQVKNQITKGDWVVRGVDASTRRSGRSGSAPAACTRARTRTSSTTTASTSTAPGLTRAHRRATAITRVTFSPDTAVLRRHLLARRSAAGHPSCSARATAASSWSSRRPTSPSCSATGWQTPEVFVAKGRDGKTDIWGVIIRPTNFDPTKKYPVIENIYAGPQGSFVPKTFSTSDRHAGAWPSSGFIVVQIDGMGTSNRSKAFHDVAWKNLGDAGFPDRILWHKAVAAKYPYYDITRVGIYGTSAGGQNALGALLFHPEFYKVARVELPAATTTGWTRSGGTSSGWAGRSARSTRRRRTSTTRTKLQGKLLLVVGEMDTNVDPVVDDAGRQRADQGEQGLRPARRPRRQSRRGRVLSATRKRNDCFVKNLLGLEAAELERAARQRDELGRRRRRDRLLRARARAVLPGHRSVDQSGGR